MFLAVQHGLKNAFILHQTNDALNKVPPPKKFWKSDKILQGAKPWRIVLPPCNKSNLGGCHEDHPEWKLQKLEFSKGCHQWSERHSVITIVNKISNYFQMLTLCLIVVSVGSCTLLRKYFCSISNKTFSTKFISTYFEKTFLLLVRSASANAK